ncbi:MAG: 30S ribosome-binding factor RbfA [Planctomycetaceae bacterium]
MAHAILETVSTTILFNLKDPRVKNVTVLNVEVADDLRTAKVYVSVMGDDKSQSLCMHGLRSARGFIQSKLASRLDTRYTPVLTFILDQSLKLSAEAARILREVLPSENPPLPGEEISDDAMSNDAFTDNDGNEPDSESEDASAETINDVDDSPEVRPPVSSTSTDSTHPQRSPPPTSG